MSVKIVSWNIEGRLSRFARKGRGSPEHILEGLAKLDGDIVFLPEASDGDKIESEITAQIKDLGYEVHTVSYDDSGSRRWPAEAAPNMKLLTRLKVKRFQQLRLGDIRNALVVDVVVPETEQTVRIFGVHLDDREETDRLKQVEDLLVHVAKSSLPTIVMGDCNAMHAADVRARFLRSRWLVHAIKRWPHARTQDILKRLSGMAIGTALAALESNSTLVDADVRRRATTTPKLRFQEWMPSIRMVQIDHIFVSPDISISNFSVARDYGSDHRAISANAELLNKIAVMA